MADSKISTLNSVTTPLNADVLPIVDTANTETKKVSWANIKATLKTYFDTLYPSGSGTSTGTNTGDQTITLTGGVTGTGTGSFAATVVTNANLTGEVTSVGNATTLTNSAVIGKVLTGYTSGAGTVASTDTILQAVQKLNGNIAAVSSIFKCGTTTKDASDASATQNIAHGLGVAPNYVRISAVIGNTGIAAYGILRSDTTYNGTTQASFSVYPNAANFSQSTSFVLNTAISAATQTGVVTFDATNIIITWTKSGSPTGVYTLLWEAFV